MTKPPCQYCEDSCEVNGDACMACTRSAEIDYQIGKKTDETKEKLKPLMMAGKIR